MEAQRKLSPTHNLQKPSGPKLLTQVRNALRARRYSVRTEEVYVQWIRRFIMFHDKHHPRDMGAAEVNQFLSDLATTQHAAASTQNQALCALLFLYRVVLQQDLGHLEGLVRAKKPKRLPEVLTADEVKLALQRVSDPAWLMMSLLYGSGLRLLECLRLRVKDVDFSYQQITVRDGKGGKDRVTMLPRFVKDALQQHLDEVKRLHTRDLEERFGNVHLPDALERKYPSASRDWVWQYVFPAATRLARSAQWHRQTAPCGAPRVTPCRQSGCPAGGDYEGGELPHLTKGMGADLLRQPGTTLLANSLRQPLAA